MNGKALVVRTMQGALANIEDNLYRYRHFGKPTDLTDNGETFASVIASLERKRDALRAAIKELSP